MSDLPRFDGGETAPEADFDARITPETEAGVAPVGGDGTAPVEAGDVSPKQEIAVDWEKISEMLLVAFDEKVASFGVEASEAIKSVRNDLVVTFDRVRETLK